MKVSHLTNEELRDKLEHLEARLDNDFANDGKGEEFWHTQELIDLVYEEMDNRGLE